MAMVRNDFILYFPCNKETYEEMFNKYMEIDKKDSISVLEGYGTIDKAEYDHYISIWSEKVEELFKTDILFVGNVICFKKINVLDFNYPVIQDVLEQMNYRKNEKQLIGIVSTNNFNGDYLDIYATKEGIKFEPSKFIDASLCKSLLDKRKYDELDSIIEAGLKKAEEQLYSR